MEWETESVRQEGGPSGRFGKVSMGGMRRDKKHGQSMAMTHAALIRFPW